MVGESHGWNYRRLESQQGVGHRVILIELKAQRRETLNPSQVVMRNQYMKYAATLTFVLLVAVVFLTACGSDEPTPAPTAAPQPTPEATTPAAVTTPEVETEWDGILGTTVLRPGSQRVAFLLAGARSLVTVPQVEVETFFVDEDGSVDGPRQTLTAEFNLWPYGTRGSYVTKVSFDRTGMWRLEVVGEEEGEPRMAIIDVEVTDGFSVVDIGQKAPTSMNRTVGGDAPLEELSSAHEPDPELYATSIARRSRTG